MILGCSRVLIRKIDSFWLTPWEVLVGKMIQICADIYVWGAVQPRKIPGIEFCSLSFSSRLCE